MKRCVIIDDDPLFLSLFEAMLMNSGIDVLSSADVEHAVNIIRDFSPDLIILDQYMPNKLGTELAAEIKANEDLVQIPILLISAMDLINMTEELQESGCVDYIDKSARADRMIETIKTYASIGMVKKAIHRDK